MVKSETGLDLIAASQLTLDVQTSLFERADQFLTSPGEIAQAGEDLKALYAEMGKLAVYFWFEEPSTRTVGSFDSARELLGLGFLGERNAKATSSTAKGESLQDSMRTSKTHLNLFGGAVVVIRHPKEGSAALAAAIHDFPVINAGDGQHEHPTQALLDMYTIRQKKGRTTGLTIAMGGDPRYSRTIHSLAEVASIQGDNELICIGGEGLWLDEPTKEALTNKGITIHETKDMRALREADVVYWTRRQSERDKKVNKMHPWRYVIAQQRNKRAMQEYLAHGLNEESLYMIKHDAIIMHPFPRGPEIPESVDNDPRAVYWDQMKYAVPLRAALIEQKLIDFHNFKLAA
jgi:aspartate carbamoyltransferase catalytic subunit